MADSVLDGGWMSDHQGRYNKWHAYANGKPSVRGDGRARRKAARKQRREDEENELAYKIVTSGNVGPQNAEPSSDVSQCSSPQILEHCEILLLLGLVRSNQV